MPRLRRPRPSLLAVCPLAMPVSVWQAEQNVQPYLQENSFRRKRQQHIKMRKLMPHRHQYRCRRQGCPRCLETPERPEIPVCQEIRVYRAAAAIPEIPVVALNSRVPPRAIPKLHRLRLRSPQQQLLLKPSARQQSKAIR
jgi:hypothetical protein